MPITPLIPSFRLTFPYIVDGFAHAFHYYLLASPSVDASGYNTVSRSGFANTGVSTLPARVWTYISPYWKAADTTFGNAHLDRLTFGAWVPVWTEANAITPAGSAAREFAAGLTVFMKSTDNLKMPIVFYELPMGIPNKFISYASLDAVTKGIVDDYANHSGTAGVLSPYAWRVSRNATYTDRWLSVVTDTNEKLRRKRNIK